MHTHTHTHILTIRRPHLIAALSLSDVARCIDGGVDPLGNLRAALTSDLAAFGSQLPSSAIREDATIALTLSDVATFPQLFATANSSGFTIASVRCASVAASVELQRQIDAAARDEGKRRAEEQAVEQAAKLSQIRLSHAKQSADEERAQEEARQVFSLQLANERHESELRWQTTRNDACAAFLQKLKQDADVDVTQLLVGYSQQKNVPDDELQPVYRLIRAAPLMQPTKALHDV
jgi:hypothetical protein